MKKILLIISLIVCALAANAQYGSKDQKSALRTVLDIEAKLLADKSDTTAVKFIQEHKKAKKALTSRLMKADGYSKIKKDKPSIDKFKSKVVKKDHRLAALDKKEVDARKAKQSYISSIDAVYKASLPKAYP